MPLSDGFSILAPASDALPTQEALTGRIEDLTARLGRLRTLPMAESYTGPVLFEGSAAAELFASTFGSRLGADRTPSFDNPMFENLAAGDCSINLARGSCRARSASSRIRHSGPTRAGTSAARWSMTKGFARAKRNWWTRACCAHC